MGLIRRIAEYLDPVERRGTDITWELMRGGMTGNLNVGGATDPRAAENLSTVLACVSAISSAMASLPAYVYRVEDNGWVIDEGNPVARLISQGPNQHQTWSDWVEWTMASVLLRGNAVSEIVTDGRGAITALRPVPWEWVSIQLLPNGRLTYDVVELTNIHGGTGRPRRLLQDEVFHLRDRSDDGLIGRSRLQRAAAVLASGLSVQEFAIALYSNGINPSGALEVEGRLGDEQRARLTTAFREGFAGPSKTAKAMILDQGLKWQQISISPEDAEFLASRRFTVEELCRLYNVPPPVAGDLTHGTFTNTETLIRWFAQATLTPWITKVQSEFSRSVFTSSNRRLEIDLSGLLRGDPATRWSAWKIAIDAGVLSPEEVRLEEGFNPRPAAEVSVS
jgi:HK97 family phage portal protein